MHIRKFYKKTKLSFDSNSSSEWMKDLLIKFASTRDLSGREFSIHFQRVSLTHQIIPLSFFLRGIFHCFSTILKEEGGLFSGSLFRGLGPTLIVSMVLREFD